jgi:hypothetical protein
VSEGWEEPRRSNRRCLSVSSSDETKLNGSARAGTHCGIGGCCVRAFEASTLDERHIGRDIRRAGRNLATLFIVERRFSGTAARWRKYNCLSNVFRTTIGASKNSDDRDDGQGLSIGLFVILLD